MALKISGAKTWAILLATAAVAAISLGAPEASAQPRKRNVNVEGSQTYDGQIGSEEWNNMVAHSKFAGKAFTDFAKVAKGRIALQQHPGSSEWRNIKIRQL